MHKRSAYFMMIILIVVFGVFIVMKTIASGGINSIVDAGDVKKIEKILQKNPKLVNKKGEFGWTPLYKAAFNGNREVAELLIAKGANVNALDSKGSSPLHISASSKDVVFNKNILNGRIEVAKILLSKGAPIDAKDNNGSTALHIAAREGSQRIAELLIVEGADVNARDNNNRTPLELATEEKHPEIVDLLRKSKENK
jgi:ankyrin repeat protein